MKQKLVLGLLLVAGSLLVSIRAPAQGSLTPPSSPAPTMRSLDQIYSEITKLTPASPLVLGSGLSPTQQGVIHLSVKGQKQGDFKGESLIKGLENSIVCIGFAHEVVSPRDAASGLPTGKRLHKPLKVMKYVDRTTPQFYSALAGNETLPTVALKFFQVDAKGALTNYFKITFTNRDSRGITYSGPRVDLFTGRMSGYVWSANVGWISLSNAWAFVQTGTILPGADTDGDGIADAWELTNFGTLSTANATSDYDGDGSSDLQEYRAGTDPKDAASTLRITSCTINPDDFTASVIWQSQPTRQYRIFRTDNLAPSVSWSDLGLGLINPGPANSTSCSFLDSGSSMGFYKIEAIKPLAP